MEAVHWKIKSFIELSVTELYEILKIRQQVFVVEQACYYLDADGYDDKAIHLWAEQNGEILAYCRIFDAGIKYQEASIGRVLTNPNYRNELLKTWEDLPEIYVTSAEKKEGGDEILKFIGETNAFLQNNKVNFQ